MSPQGWKVNVRCSSTTLSLSDAVNDTEILIPPLVFNSCVDVSYYWAGDVSLAPDGPLSVFDDDDLDLDCLVRYIKTRLYDLSTCLCFPLVPSLPATLLTMRVRGCLRKRNSGIWMWCAGCRLEQKTRFSQQRKKSLNITHLYLSVAANRMPK